MVLNYNIPRSYNLTTPRRKKLTRLLIRGKPPSVACQVLKDPRYLSPLLLKMGRIIAKEVAVLCSDRVSSLLSSSKKNDFVTFKWEKLFEVESHAPCLLKILTTALQTKNENKTAVPLIGVIVSILCSFRRRSMNLIQKIVSVILYAGHCSKQVIMLHV